MTAEVAEAEKAGDPALLAMQKQLAALRGQRGALFQGETPRGLLLTSIGFSDLRARAGQAATVAYAAASLLGLLSLACLARGLRAPVRRAVAGITPVGATADGNRLAG